MDVLFDFAPLPLKARVRFKPRSQVTFWKSSKIIIICTRNARSNVPKSILNCFGDTQDMFCCKNNINTLALIPNFSDETRNVRDFDRFLLSELGFDMTIWKDPRQQSTKVEKSKIQCFSFTKNQKLLKKSVWAKSYQRNHFDFFLLKKNQSRSETDLGL